MRGSGRARGVRGARGVLVALMSALALSGCGESKDPVELDEDVRYVASLTALNGSGVTGSVEVILDEEEDAFLVAVDAARLAPHTPHPQHIHAAPSCPTLSHDANGDGFVDMAEGLDVFGLILVTLDAELHTVATDSFPTATATGRISYERRVSLRALLDLLADEPLALDTRVVVIHGVHPDAGLPETVGTVGGRPPEWTVPVACGGFEASQ